MASEVAYSSYTFATLKEVEFRGTHQNYKNVIDELEKGLTDLGSFHNTVDARGSELQKGGIIIPSALELKTEELGFVQEYERLYAIALQAQVLSEQLKHTMDHLTPKDRLYADVELTKRFAPALHAELEKTDETCKKHVQELQILWSRADVIQTKMRTQLMGDVGWAVQRFSHIVSNGGQPLGMGQRLWNNCGSAVVGSSQEVKEQLQALQEKKEDVAV